ncbi:peptidoglycan-associated lipoprotein Pal [Phenylobacterium sp.]|uniref:peptidoglycan-associated lipoprotein Pal n=1 Tax=Phenylobacterium sp. TaxID=1871053 RepID=UPI00272F6E21|nr:peptidoglycan-associated lipoprotein Pal [Phenylobacterium sp.]MDP1599674.1 peptidoglycan-associated lipoprotein Pal [Phenylobacterium sp.]MDP3594944.1 peptidoglycan-associated lipoprotein Pal [Phenylobacterium sp.]
MQSFNTKHALRLALVAAAALSVTACASRPKPGPAPEPAPPPAVAPTPTPTPAPAPSATVTPGTIQDFVVNVGERVFFDLDSYSVRADAAPLLDAQAAWLVRYPNVQVRIEGNADERGTREYNLALGSRRANSVREHLVSRGVAPSRISTVSFGKERPIDPGTTEDAFQQNRNARTAIVGGAQ